MRVLLTGRDQDFEIERALPANATDLIQDLELDTLIEAMSGGDPFIRTVARVAILTPLEDPDAIAYRQSALRDCLEHGEVAREIYAVALEALQTERRHWAPLNATPQSLLSRSQSVMSEFVDTLTRLRQIAERHREAFRSEAFGRLFEMFVEELDDDYLQRVRELLGLLGAERGSLASVRLGEGNKGVDHVLREPEQETWIDRVSPFRRHGYSFELAERDHPGVRALGELADRTLNPAANAMAQSAEHIVAFLRALLTELAFYIGALNLHERLTARGAPTCLPTPLVAGEHGLSAVELYDVPLALQIDSPVVGNDLDADGRPLIVITGANRGGKSTLLRSLGVAQLMLQSGLFVGAERLTASVRGGVFTHYRREEDASMTDGKLVEELRRMSALVDLMGPTSMVLCNESFASTNEREGSEIGGQAITAMIEAGVRVAIVTHQYELARRLGLLAAPDTTLFVRADPTGDGGRSFRLIPGDPLPTSHGIDTYRDVFATAP